MFNKSIDTLTIEDLEDLIDRRERENIHLEYKEKIGNSDYDKKEFLKDVSGFANGNGGFLIVGVKEEDGIPTEILGVDKKIGNQKIDEWINNVLLANIELRIHYKIKLIETGNKFIIVLNISESPKKPHMVTFNSKNCYFIRHNTSVDIATHNEVKEMFEFSGKIRNKLEDFLKFRNLFDENNLNFGRNGNVEKLYFQNDSNKKPALIYSFIPEYIDEYRTNIVSKDLLDWLEINSKGFEPLPRLELFNLRNKKINLYGMIIPEIYDDYEAKIEYFKNYFEFQNNGFFEEAKSTNLFYIFPSNKKIVLHLSWAVGFAYILMNFAKSFYTKINYFEEFIFQMSFINVKGAVLGGFGKPSPNKYWPEPFIALENSYPPTCIHENFKIIEKLSINEMTENKIKEILLNISFNLSHAFGVSEVKCFDEQGNFNNEKMFNFTL